MALVQFLEQQVWVWEAERRRRVRAALSRRRQRGRAQVPRLNGRPAPKGFPLGNQTAAPGESISGTGHSREAA